MAVYQNIVTLTTVSQVTPPAVGVAHPVIPNTLIYPWSTATVTIQNIDIAATVYIGNSATVSSTNYGVSLAFGAAITFDGLFPTEPLYAVSSSAGTKVSVLSVQR